MALTPTFGSNCRGWKKKVTARVPPQHPAVHQLRKTVLGFGWMSIGWEPVLSFWMDENWLGKSVLWFCMDEQHWLGIFLDEHWLGCVM